MSALIAFLCLVIFIVVVYGTLSIGYWTFKNTEIYDSGICDEYDESHEPNKKGDIWNN